MRADLGRERRRRTGAAERRAHLLGELELPAAVPAEFEVLLNLRLRDPSEVAVEIRVQPGDGFLAADHAGAPRRSRFRCSAYRHRLRSSCLRPRKSRASTVPVVAAVISPISRAVKP